MSSSVRWVGKTVDYFRQLWPISTLIDCPARKRACYKRTGGITQLFFRNTFSCCLVFPLRDVFYLSVIAPKTLSIFKQKKNKKTDGLLDAKETLRLHICRPPPLSLTALVPCELFFLRNCTVRQSCVDAGVSWLVNDGKRRRMNVQLWGYFVFFFLFILTQTYTGRSQLAGCVVGGIQRTVQHTRTHGPFLFFVHSTNEFFWFYLLKIYLVAIKTMNLSFVLERKWMQVPDVGFWQWDVAISCF